MTDTLPDDTRRRLRQLTPVERMVEAGSALGLDTLRDVVAYSDPLAGLEEVAPASPWTKVMRDALATFEETSTARDTILRSVIPSVEAMPGRDGR